LAKIFANLFIFREITANFYSIAISAKIAYG